MSHRLYLYNLAEVGNPNGACLGLMEWSYELPLMLQPLLSGGPFVGANCFNDPGSEEGLYAEAPAGIQALHDFYAFLERHAASLLDDPEAFRRAREKIFHLLDNRALHPWFHLDAWDVFNMSDEDRREQAQALLDEIARNNAGIRQAIDNDNPALLDDCLAGSWAESFRTLLNHRNYDYGWEPLGSLLPQRDGEVEIFEQDGLCGLRGFGGEVLLAPRYQAIYDFDWASGLAVAVREDRFGYLDQQGHEVIPCQFEDAYDFAGEHALVGEGGKLGLIDRQGELRVPCQFDAGEPLGYDGRYWAVQQDGLWGVIDNRGSWQLPAQFQEIREHGSCYRAKPTKGPAQLFTSAFHGLGAVALDNIDCQFLSEAEGDCYILRRREGKQWRYRVVDARNETLLPGEFQSLKYLHDMQAWLVRDQGLYGLYCHRRQSSLLPCRYRVILPQENLSRDDDGSYYSLIQDDDRQWGLYRGGPHYAWSIEPQYQALTHLDGGFFGCRRADHWGIVDKHGRLLREIADELPATARCRPSHSLALAFRDGHAWRVLDDGTAQPLSADEALRAIDVYGRDGFDEAQLECLRRSAGDRWLARQAHNDGLAAYEAGDYARARPLIERAVELGFGPAMNELGCLLQNQDGDYAGALLWYRRGAEAGSGVSARNLGSCYENGLGCEIDLAQARHYYEMAVQLGYLPAQLELADLLMRQEPPVGDADLALEHYLAAWRRGCKDESAVCLGWLYEQREEFDQAMRYYQHAAKHGESYAHWHLGRFYLHGQGTRANPHKALEHLRIASEMEREGAYLDLALLYLHTPELQDAEAAATWLEKALAAEVEGAAELAEQLAAEQKKPGLLARLFDKRSKE